MKIGVVPRYAELLENKIFKGDNFDLTKFRGVDRPGFSALKNHIENEGHLIATFDCFDSSEIDVYFFLDMNYYHLYNLHKQKSEVNIIYMMREAPSAVPFNSTASLITHRPLFDRIITWNDELSDDREDIFEYNLPYCSTDFRYDEREPFEKKKLLVNISSRKYSSHPDELYSVRKNLIEYYDTNYPGHFSLYGYGWNDPPTPMEMYRGQLFPNKFETYEGLADNKIDVYHNHKFAICFENMAGIPGWITEKIFDCFRAGIVPIYWGASNIAEYVPSEAYIDYRDFQSPSNLHDYLLSITESEYREYLQAAESYLESNDQFKPQSFAEKVSEILLSVEDKKGTNIGYLLDNIEAQAHLDRMMYDPTAVPKREYVSRWLRLLRANPQLLVEKPQATYFGLRRVLPGELGEIR